MSALPILTVLRDGETLKSQPIDQDVVIGRGEGCVIRLDDRAVSRNHAVIKKTSEGIQIEKKSEFAPIKVNGAECTRVIVKEGDLIEIGPYLMRLSAGKAAAQAAQQPLAPLPPAPPVSAAAAPAAAVAEEVLEPMDLGAALAMPIDASPVAEASPVEALEPLSLDGFESASSDPSGAQPLEIQTGPIEHPAETESSEPVSMEFETSDAAPAVDEDAKTRIQKRVVEARLVFAEGAANHDALDLGKAEISIGRGKQCDVVVNDKKASRKNSVIAKVGNRYVIRDLESANGTYVNGKQIKGEHELSHGDQIRVGEAEFQFLAENSDYQKQEAGGFHPVASEDEAPLEANPFEMEAEGLASPLASPLSPDGSGADDLGLGADSLPPGFGDPGLGAEEAPAEPEKKGLALYYDRYIRNFPKLPITQKIIVVGVVFLALSFLYEEDTPPPAPKAAVAKKAAAAKTGTPIDNLTEEQKKKLEEAYQLAFDYYANKRDYDNAIFQANTALAILPEYSKAKEIKEFATEAKRRLDAAAAEEAKKEEEAKLKARIAELVESTAALMKKKDYAAAEPQFGEILALDPENKDVDVWKSEIEAFNEERSRKEQERQVQEEINRRAWDTYNEGLALQKKGQYHEAIKVYGGVGDLGASDMRPTKKAEKGIEESTRSIASARDPLLAEGRRLEAEDDMYGAFRNYQAATRADPPHPDGYAGMDRVRGVMNDRAKALYTEAVIAESYSDFSTAYSKYQAILKSAPEGSTYYDRAKRKLGAYFNYKPEGGDEAEE